MEFFERKKAFNMPNVILFECEVKEEVVVFGGYSSHGWVRQNEENIELYKLISNDAVNLENLVPFGGDDSCFLFNLTHNLRFDSIKCRDGCYTSTIEQD